jgi:UV DNA damage repair endonuclease
MSPDGALADFAQNLELLSHRVRSRLTVENDDKTFAPADLLPSAEPKVCRWSTTCIIIVATRMA